jgi:hypothetical protein
LIISRRKARVTVVHDKIRSTCQIDSRHTDQRFHISGIERQSALEKPPRPPHVFGGHSLIPAATALETQVHCIRMQ